MTQSLPRAALVLSGDELLDGRTADTNGAFLSGDLSARGARVTSLLVVADDPERLTAALRFSLAPEPDLLLVGGGLGTTHDDLTAACLAEALGVELRPDPQASAWVEERTRAVAARRHLRFDDLWPQARRQALLPAGATALAPAGVAPGIAARSGTTRIFAFPGVPYELETMWRAVADGLEAEGFFPPVTARLLRIFGVGELQVAPVIESVPRDLLDTGINVGGGEVTVRLRYPRSPAAEAQAAAVVAALEAAVPVYSSDGRTVDDLVAAGLVAREQTVAVAESCTGGLLGGRFTTRPGSSDYFVGGVISYSDALKRALLGVPQELLDAHGAVSVEVAGAMAEGVRAVTGATYGLSVTGVAGPDGGSDEKPVGLVCFGCSGPRGTRLSRGHFPGDREAVRAWGVTRALHLLREQLEP